MSSLETAIAYVKRGWNPVPIPRGMKRPLDDAWQRRRIDAETASRFFSGSPQNIGVQLGEASSGLTDVDLDCAEAIAIARYLLPMTGAVFGRASKRSSHWLYRTNLSASVDSATIQFKDPRTKGMVLELRIGGGDKGAQTVFPGSIHESGEAVAWEQGGEPASLDGGRLRRAACLVAACSLMARHWPTKGSRHDAARVVGGFLARAGQTPVQVRLAAEAIAKAIDDPEWQDRRKAAEDAAIAFRSGKKAYGIPAMSEMFGEDVAGRIAEWLDYRNDGEAPSQPRDEAHPEPSATLESIRASKVKVSAIEWLWQQRFALGKLGLLVGLPDEGKGQILADMAARVTRGAEWPCDEGRAPQGNVILLSAEDGEGDTVTPRLMAADADLDCIEIVRMTRAETGKRMFSLVSDLPLLRNKIAEVGNVKLIQIDPISAYLGVGKVDSFRTSDVRAVLAPLVELADELKVAVVGILHFNKKLDVTNALLRISDSLAFGATARHVYAAVDDAENKRKLVVRAKNNLARQNLGALAYNFGLRDVGVDPDTGAPIRAPHILWHAKHVDITATEAMQTTRSPAARDEAKKFLGEFLAGGPKPSTEVEEAAEANGISRRTLFRVKGELQVAARKHADGWVWQLPERRRPQSYE